MRDRTPLAGLSGPGLRLGLPGVADRAKARAIADLERLVSRTASRPGLGLACVLGALALSVPVPCAGASDGAPAGGQGIATPLRLVNLNPFHLVYGVPASAGARVMPGDSWEAIASLDIASHLRGGGSGTERVLIDGETWRQGLALRYGLGDGWELLVDVPVVSHTGGAFDGFIEVWHDAFDLPQGDRCGATIWVRAARQSG